MTAQRLMAMFFSQNCDSISSTAPTTSSENMYLQPNPSLHVPAIAERKQILQLVCWYTNTFLLYW